MADKVRVGLIGSSGWAEFMTVGALKSHPGAEIAAVSSRNPEMLAAFASKHAIPNTFTDYREMLSSGLIDAVVIASPDDQHREHAIAAFDAGLHVLCEKPLALSVADAGAMLAAANASGKLHLVPYTGAGSRTSATSRISSPTATSAVPCVPSSTSGASGA